MTTIDELARRIERVESELALHHLVHDYCGGVDPGRCLADQP